MQIEAEISVTGLRSLGGTCSDGGAVGAERSNESAVDGRLLDVAVTGVRGVLSVAGTLVVLLVDVAGGGGLRCRGYVDSGGGTAVVGGGSGGRALGLGLGRLGHGGAAGGGGGVGCG